MSNLGNYTNFGLYFPKQNNLQSPAPNTALETPPTFHASELTTANANDAYKTQYIALPIMNNHYQALPETIQPREVKDITNEQKQETTQPTTAGPPPKPPPEEMNASQQTTISTREPLKARSNKEVRGPLPFDPNHMSEQQQMAQAPLGPPLPSRPKRATTSSLDTLKSFKEEVAHMNREEVMKVLNDLGKGNILSGFPPSFKAQIALLCNDRLDNLPKSNNAITRQRAYSAPEPRRGNRLKRISGIFQKFAPSSKRASAIPAGEHVDLMKSMKEKLSDLAQGLRKIPPDTAISASCQVIKEEFKTTIKTVKKEIKDINIKIALLKEKGDRDSLSSAEELSKLQRDLGIALFESFEAFIDIRKQLRNLCELPGLPIETKKELMEAHENLSSVMQQKSTNLRDHVVFMLPKVSIIKSAKNMFFNPSSRKLIRDIISIGSKAIFQALGEKFKGKATGSDDSPLNRAKALITNKFFAIAQLYNRMLFGGDLISASRNVVREEVIMKRSDLNTSEEFLDKFKKFLGENAGMLIETKRRHITEGICEGTCLQLSLEILRNPESDYKSIAQENVNGASEAAHANHVCYNVADDLITLKSVNELFEHRMTNALGLEKKGSFEAVGENVLSAIKYIHADRQAGNQSPLMAAIKAYEKSEDGQKNTMITGNTNLRYMNDTAAFKKGVELELQSKLKGQELQIALNELEWTVAALELINFQMITEGTIGSYTNAHGVIDLKAVQKKPSPLSHFSNSTIGKHLDIMYEEESDYVASSTVANFRGLELKRVDIGSGYFSSGDAEMLDRISKLPDGTYSVGISLSEGGHALQYHKKGGQEYLFDPNVGVIDCTGGRLKEQFTKLMSNVIYSPAKNQGPNSNGKSHNIIVYEVIDKGKEKDCILQ